MKHLLSTGIYRSFERCLPQICHNSPAASRGRLFVQCQRVDAALFRERAKSQNESAALIEPGVLAERLEQFVFPTREAEGYGDRGLGRRHDRRIETFVPIPPIHSKNLLHLRYACIQFRYRRQQLPEIGNGPMIESSPFWTVSVFGSKVTPQSYVWEVAEVSFRVFPVRDSIPIEPDMGNLCNSDDDLRYGFFRKLFLLEDRFDAYRSRFDRPFQHSRRVGRNRASAEARREGYGLLYADLSCTEVCHPAIAAASRERASA